MSISRPENQVFWPNLPRSQRRCLTASAQRGKLVIRVRGLIYLAAEREMDFRP